MFAGRFGVVLLPALLLALWAQWRLLAAYRRWSQRRTTRDTTGAMAAREILDAAGLQAVPVEHVQGYLTDHYDPRSRTLRLSDEVYAGDNVAAVGIAAHEAGHALQHQEGLGLLQWRLALAPVVQIGSWAALPILVVGMVMRIPPLVLVGLVLFVGMLVFQLVTLPVEYDASRRARQRLLERGLINPQELDGVDRVLNAAAWTYIAALTMSVLQLVRWLKLSLQRR